MKALIALVVLLVPVAILLLKVKLAKRSSQHVGEAVRGAVAGWRQSKPDRRIGRR